MLEGHVQVVMELVVVCKCLFQVQDCQRLYISVRSNAEEVVLLEGSLADVNIQGIDVNRVPVDDLVPVIFDRAEVRFVSGGQWGCHNEHRNKDQSNVSHVSHIVLLQIDLNNPCST